MQIEPLFETVQILYGKKPTEWEPWLHEKIILCKDIERDFAERAKVGKGRQQEVYQFRAIRLKAEAELAKLLERQQAKP